MTNAIVRFIEKMQHTVLVIGSGGREHAICWKLSQSPHVSELITENDKNINVTILYIKFNAMYTLFSV